MTAEPRDVERTAGAGPGAPRGWLVAAASLPLAAALAFGGQFLVSLRTGTLWTAMLPGCALYAAALGLLTVTFARRGVTAADEPAEGAPSGRTEWVLLALVLFAGLFLRLYAIDVTPRGLNNDEAINAIEAKEIAAGKPFATYTVRGLNRETMFHYLAAFSFERPGLLLNILRALPGAFGLSPRLINDTLADLVIPLRGVAIVAGTLTILLLYLFARSAFGTRVALFAALFLAVSPWHLLYSRVGERVILAPIFAIATAGLFLRALRTGKMIDHLLWGLAAGFGFWTYTSFRAVPLALAAFAVLFLRRRVPAPWRGLAAGAAVAVVLLIGIMAFSGMTPAAFVLRGAYAARPPESHWIQNLVHAVTMQNYFPATYAVIQSDAFISDGISTTFGLIGLEPDTLLLAAFATLGIVCLAWRGFARARADGGGGDPGAGRDPWAGRDPAAALLVLMILSLWLTIGWLGPSLTRMLLNLPWLCVAAAVLAVGVWDGCAALLRPLGARLPRVAGRLVAAVPVLLMAGVAALAGAQGYSNYFLLAARSDRAMQNFGATQTIMGMYTRALPPDQDVIVLHTLRVDTLHYLIGDRPNVQFITDTTKVSLEKLINVPRTITFVIEYARPFAEPLRSLMMRFPQADMGQVADARLDPDKVIFYTFTIWKDAMGQIISAPGTEPAPPGGMSLPGAEPPGAAPPPPGGSGGPPQGSAPPS